MPLLTDEKCNCDWPMLWEAGNPTFLGRLVRVRLCCLMKAMEDYFEVDFHETFDGEPVYAWNKESTGKNIPGYLKSRIAAKKLQGFSMEAPVEPEADLWAREDSEDGVEGNTAYSVDPKMVDHALRSKGLVVTGRKKAWNS